MNSTQILNKAIQIESQVIDWRRSLHQIPEIGLNLPKTVAFVCQQLDDIGIPYDSTFVNGNAIVALIHGTKLPQSEQVLAIRADMDALPIKEETGLPFQSTNGNMHACGHDGHTAVLLGTAKLLYENRHKFNGTVKLLFQPGEEGPGGAQPMIDEGALLNPTVTRIIGSHQGGVSEGTLNTTFNLKPGPLAASVDTFDIDIIGKGYHGAYPEGSHDPIVAAGHLITSIQTIRSRDLSGLDSAVISLTQLEGGINYNIIPEKVHLKGTIRTFDPTVRQYIKNRLQEICSGLGQMMNVKCHLVCHDKYPTLVNDKDVTHETMLSLIELFEDSLVGELEHPFMGGEDMACFLNEVPGTFFFIHNPGFIEGKFHGHHSPKFDIDESKLYLSVAAFVKLTVDYLT
ncbi:M20 metallopeptidase family protein [Dolosigranulum pigrum]|jgi:amidohydrolase